MVEPLRVVLADDHAMVREALAQILQESDGIEVVGQASEGNEAVRLVTETLPQVLVVDYTMPGLDGPAVIESLRNEPIEMQAVVLTVHENPHYAVRALQSGALGYVVKSAAVQELVEAIQTVHRGERYISPRVRDKVLDQLARAAKKGGGGLGALSAREFDVLRALGRGMTLTECAAHLKISKSTASTYRVRLMEKLGLETTAEVIRFAVDNDVAK